MNKTLSSLLLSGLCVGMTCGVRAADEAPPAAPAPAPAAEVKPADSKPATVDKNAPPAPIPQVDLKVLAPATFKELEGTKREAISDSDLDVTMHSSIRRLATSGWEEARLQLLNAGKAAVPYLIDALGQSDQNYPLKAFNLGGHSKADSGRGVRERTLAEACSEVLTDLITNHSNYAGDLPTLDQKAWQDWWTANGTKVTFGN